MRLGDLFDRSEKNPTWSTLLKGIDFRRSEIDEWLQKKAGPTGKGKKKKRKTAADLEVNEIPIRPTRFLKRFVVRDQKLQT